jgi:uncharacterized protein (UPF0276 family)
MTAVATDPRLTGPESLDGLVAARDRQASRPYPLIGLSWDVTTEHAKLEPATRRYLPAAEAFMVGPYAGDTAAVDLALEYCLRHGFSPLVHTLDLDLCGIDPLDSRVLSGLADAVRRLGVDWVTTDLAMWSYRGQPLVDNLVAIPWVDGVVEHVVPRVIRIQEELGVRVAVENSAYAFGVGELNPYSVQDEIARRADARLCFDVGHALITAEVTGRDPVDLIPDDFSWDLVVEGHLAGVTTLACSDGVTSDDQHRAPIAPRVFSLAARTLAQADNLVAWVAESEGITAGDLAHKVAAMHREVRLWRL